MVIVYCAIYVLFPEAFSRRPWHVVLTYLDPHWEEDDPITNNVIRSSTNKGLVKWRLILLLIVKKKVVVLFGTLKVQSLMLIEVRDCDLLIVVTSSAFIKRKDMLKEKNS